MKVILQAIGTILVCYLLQTFLPWWTLTIGACGVAYLTGNKPWVAFIVGFASIAALWVGTIYYIEWVTDAVLSTKLNQLFPMSVFIMSLLVGGLVGGLAALTGALARKKPNTAKYY